MIIGNKKLQFNVDMLPTYGSLFLLMLQHREKCDNPGYYFKFCFFKLFTIEIKFFDIRYWNIKTQELFSSYETKNIKENSNLEIIFKRLTYLFDKKEADKLLSDLVRLQPMIHSVFLKYKHAYVSEFYQEVSETLGELEKWLRKKSM